MTDENIVTRLQQRQEDAVQALQQRYGLYCMAIARRILGNEADAQEVVNDVLMQAWQSIPDTKPDNLRLYLAKLTRNAALRHIEFQNAQKRSGVAVQLDELAQILPDRLSDLEPDTQILKELIQQFLRTLPAERRNIFLRRYWFGDSVEELADRFGCSQSRITTILFRLRKQLKNHLEKEGFNL